MSLSCVWTEDNLSHFFFSPASINLQPNKVNEDNMGGAYFIRDEKRNA